MSEYGRSMLDVDFEETHKDECDKHWRTTFGVLVSAEDCPTCKALKRVEGPGIYDEKDLPVVEQLYAAPGWTYNEANR